MKACNKNDSTASEDRGSLQHGGVTCPFRVGRPSGACGTSGENDGGLTPPCPMRGGSGSCPYGRTETNPIHALFDEMIDIYYNGI